MSEPHYITSRAELRRILEDVKAGRVSTQEAYASIDLTMRHSHLALADWIEKKAKEIRDVSHD